MKLERMAILRNEKSILQKEIAIHLHLSPGTISNYENGYHSPDLDTLCGIADFLDVSIDYLLGRSMYRDIPDFMKEYTDASSRLYKLIQIYFLLDDRNQKLLCLIAEIMQQIR